MKLNIRKTLTGLFLLSCISGFAQTHLTGPLNKTNHERCKSAVIHHQLMQTDPQYAAKVMADEAQINQIITSGARTGGIYTIPVVVHVLHLGEAIGTGTNISDAQINSAIANLNDCYGGLGSYPTDIEVQFQLAQRDPFCNATTGIVRVNASAVSDYSSNGITTANELTIKAISNWPNSEYYNIWIVSEIDNNGGGAGTQGYAYFPGASSGRDGAVILYNSFGYDPTGTIGYNLKSYTRHNATANHELGHAFNLYHTFEGDDANDDGTADQCPANTTCTTDGDLCCDTEAHRRDDGDCGATGTTCTGQSIVTIVENIMAYSSDVCQVRFTDDQKARMRAAISTTRASLLTSPALLPVTGSSPVVSKSCSPQTTNLSNTFSMGVFGLTIGGTSYSTSGAVADGGFRDNWCSSFSLASNTLYSITVTNGTLNNEKVKVYIDYNNDGDFEDSGENVYTDNVGAKTHSGSFTTIASPVTGQALWLRVISDFANNTISSSCYAPQYGQVEDFSVTFSGGCTAPTITGTTPGSRCGTGTVVLGATASAGTLNWYSASTGGTSLGTGTSFTTPSIGATTTYFVDATNGGCTSARTSVTATVNATPSVTGTTPGSRCGTGTVVLGATASAGTLNWYSASTGGTSLGTGTSFTTPSIGSTTTYFVDATNGGCTSARTSVTATVNSTVTPTVAIAITTGSNPSCAGSLLTFTASPVNGGTSPSYQWTINGVNSGTNSSVFSSSSLSDNSIVNCVMTSNAACASPLSSTSNNITVSINAVPVVTANATPSSTICNGSTVTLSGSGASSYSWSGGVNNATAFTPASTQTYTVTGTSSGCSSTAQITVTVNNCGGGTTTKLSAASCGATGLSASSIIYCDPVSGASDYEFTISNSSLGYSQFKTRATYNNIPLNSFTGLVYGTTYDVTVKAKVAGIWSAPGPVCQISLMSFPATQLNSSSCGAAGLSISSVINAVAVSGASDYEFTIVNSALGYSQVKIRSTYAAIGLNAFTGLQYGQSYDVNVRAKVSGIWGPAGSTCQIALMSFPATQLTTASCGATNLTSSSLIYCDVVSGSSDYEFTLSNTTLGYSQTKLKPVYAQIGLSSFTGLTLGQTYNVSVRAKVSGIFGPAGSVCQITMSATGIIINNETASRMYSAMELPETDKENKLSELRVYPNPSGDEGFEFILDTEFDMNHVQIQICDMIGRVVYSEKTEIPKDFSKHLNAGHELSPGMYMLNVIVEGDQRFSRKILIR
jgi:hypothetical protein